ncbi:MAG: hypothetical protein KBI32_12950, partial [Phycisphaerae bacterium]|nr:hypothetical protein [Phycisphaerae bacterium]
DVDDRDASGLYDAADLENTVGQLKKEAKEIQPRMMPLEELNIPQMKHRLPFGFPQIVSLLPCQEESLDPVATQPQGQGMGPPVRAAETIVQDAVQNLHLSLK